MKKFLKYYLLFLLPFTNTMFLVACHTPSSLIKGKINPKTNIDLEYHQSDNKDNNISRLKSAFSSFYESDNNIDEINLIREKILSNYDGFELEQKQNNKLINILIEVLGKEKSVILFNAANYFWNLPATTNNFIQYLLSEEKLSSLKFESHYNLLGEYIYQYDFKINKIDQFEHWKKFLKAKINNLSHFLDLNDDTILKAFFASGGDNLLSTSRLTASLLDSSPPKLMGNLFNLWLSAKQFTKRYILSAEFFTTYLKEIRKKFQKYQNKENILVKFSDIFGNTITLALTMTIVASSVYLCNRIVVWKWKNNNE